MFAQEDSQDIPPQSEKKTLAHSEVRAKKKKDGTTRAEPQGTAAIKKQKKTCFWTYKAGMGHLLLRTTQSQIPAC